MGNIALLDITEKAAIDFSTEYFKNKDIIK